jgi:hypothetical protein
MWQFLKENLFNEAQFANSFERVAAFCRPPSAAQRVVLSVVAAALLNFYSFQLAKRSNNGQKNSASRPNFGRSEGIGHRQPWHLVT